MYSVIIRIDPSRVQGLDADIRYTIPRQLSEASGGEIEDDGYDYEDGTDAMHIYLSTNTAETAVPIIVNYMQSEVFRGTGLAAAVQVSIANASPSGEDDYRVVYP